MDPALIAQVSAVGNSSPAASLISATPDPSSVLTDAARFRSMLDQPAATRDPTTISSATGVAPSAAVPRVSLGDQILDNIQAAGVRYDTLSHSVTSSLQSTNDNMAVRDMLRLQCSVSEISLQLELYSKGVGKLLQHVDTLTKLQ